MEESKKRNKRRKAQKLTEKLFGEAQPKVKVVEGVSVDVNVSQDLSNIF